MENQTECKTITAALPDNRLDEEYIFLNTQKTIKLHLLHNISTTKHKLNDQNINNMYLTTDSIIS